MRRTLEELSKRSKGGLMLYYVSCEFDVYHQVSHDLWTPTPDLGRLPRRWI